MTRLNGYGWGLLGGIALALLVLLLYGPALWELVVVAFALSVASIVGAITRA